MWGSLNVFEKEMLESLIFFIEKSYFWNFKIDFSRKRWWHCNSFMTKSDFIEQTSVKWLIQLYLLLWIIRVKWLVIFFLEFVMDF